MRILSLAREAKAIIFDLDGTLYTNPSYMRFQEDILIERLARERGEPLQTTRALLAGMRAEREASGLGRTSMGRLFAELGIDIETSVLWRAELIEPRDWLEPDPVLDGTLGLLGRRYALAVVTNNPRSIGEKGLEALGVRRRISTLVGLDDTMMSKPAPEPFRAAARLLGVVPERCISVGDREDVDLSPALALDMGAILVSGVEDVYSLPEILDGARR